MHKVVGEEYPASNVHDLHACLSLSSYGFIEPVVYVTITKHQMSCYDCENTF